jgi:PAS domain S-box-containing protein
MVREKEREESDRFPVDRGKLPTPPLRDWRPNPSDLVESAGDIIYALDLEGRFTFYNPKVCKLLGYGPREFLGRHLTEPLTPKSAKAALEHFRLGVEGQEPTDFLDVEVVKKDGGTLQVEIMTTNLYHSGRLVGRQGIARDISELKRLQAEVAQKADRISLLEERNRIARELYDRIAEIVFGSSAGHRVTDALLSELRSSLRGEVARDIGLSDTDLTIIELLARGYSNRETGEQVCLSPDTVKDHVRKIMDRLGVRRRTALVAEAARRGLI